MAKSLNASCRFHLLVFLKDRVYNVILVITLTLSLLLMINIVIVIIIIITLSSSLSSLSSSLSFFIIVNNFSVVILIVIIVLVSIIIIIIIITISIIDVIIIINRYIIVIVILSLSFPLYLSFLHGTTDPCYSKKCPPYAKCVSEFGTFAKCICPTRCSLALYDPTCGTDHKSYFNLCALQMTACQSNLTITAAYKGTCGIMMSYVNDSLLVSLLSVLMLIGVYFHPLIYSLFSVWNYCMPFIFQPPPWGFTGS